MRGKPFPQLLLASERAGLFIIGLSTLLFTEPRALAQTHYESYYLHLLDHPRGGNPSWGTDNREVQGITHDDAHWYITGTDFSPVPRCSNWDPPRSCNGTEDCRDPSHPDSICSAVGFCSFWNPLRMCTGDADCKDPSHPSTIYPCNPQYLSTSFLLKIPVSVDVDQDFGANPHGAVESTNLVLFPAIAHIDSLGQPHGYLHWGDLDHYKYNGADYLIVPVTAPQDVEHPLPSPAVLIFRAADLSLVGFGKLPGAPDAARGGPQVSVGWVAVTPDLGPVNHGGDLISSSDTDVRVLFRYHFAWEHLPTAGYFGEFPEAWLTWRETHLLLDASGVPLDVARGTLLHNMQGGEFTPSGELLYITSGSGSCGGFGEGDSPTDGIHVLRTTDWREIARSTNHDWQDSTCADYPRQDPLSYFDYHYDSNCGCFETDSHTAEGLTIWDLEDGRAPCTPGQLHVLAADVCGFLACNSNAALLENFGSIYVDSHGSDPVLAEPLPGSPLNACPTTPGQPFDTLNHAFGFYPVWDGAQIILNAGSYPETGRFTTRVRLVSRGGVATIGK